MDEEPLYSPPHLGIRLMQMHPKSHCLIVAYVYPEKAQSSSGAGAAFAACYELAGDQTVMER